MADAQTLCSVTVLPTAAAEPVVNPKRRGRYPANIVPLWRLRNQRSFRRYKEDSEHAARLHMGLVVKICDHASPNFGRLCRILCPGGEQGYWTVKALAGELLLKSGERSQSAEIHYQAIEPQGIPRRAAR